MHSSRRESAAVLVATAVGLMCVAWLVLLVVAVLTADVGIETEPRGVSPWFLVPAALALASLVLGGVGLQRRVGA